MKAKFMVKERIRNGGLVGNKEQNRKCTLYFKDFSICNNLYPIEIRGQDGGTPGTLGGIAYFFFFKTSREHTMRIITDVIWLCTSIISYLMSNVIVLFEVVMAVFGIATVNTSII